MNQVIICPANCMKACCINKIKVVNPNTKPIVFDPPYYSNSDPQPASSYPVLDAYHAQQQDQQNQLYTLVE